MAKKQRREREKSRRAEALAQSIDKLVFLGEISRPEPSENGRPKPRDTADDGKDE